MQLQNYASLASQDKGIKLDACHPAASMENPDRHTSDSLHNLFTCGPTRTPALTAVAASHTAAKCDVSIRAVSFLPSRCGRLLGAYPSNSNRLLNQSNRHCKRQRLLKEYDLHRRLYPTLTHPNFTSRHLSQTMRRKPNYRELGKPYRGGNTDNYVKQHFKKLEAEGRCCKCAEKIGSQGEEAHKKSCKANGAKCKYCSSKGFGSRAKGHLEAACAKKLHAQVRNIDADGADDESASTRSPQSSSEEEYDDGAEIHRITVEDSSSDDDSSEEEYESDDEETNWVDDWMANSDEEADDNDWAPLPGYYSYSSDDEECPEDKTEQEDHDDDSLRLQQAQVLKLSQQQGEAFSSLVSRFDNSWDQAKMGKLSTEELQGLMHEARRPSKSVRRRRRRRAAVARVKQAAANRQVPLVYVLEDISNVPKNVPVPMFDINFRQHERRGPWHSVSAIADTGANRSIFSLDVLKRAKIGIHSSRREKIKLASQQASMTSNGHIFLRV